MKSALVLCCNSKFFPFLGQFLEPTRHPYFLILSSLCRNKGCLYFCLVSVRTRLRFKRVVQYYCVGSRRSSFSLFAMKMNGLVACIHTRTLRFYKQDAFRDDLCLRSME